MEFDDSSNEIGWLMADAQATMSFPSTAIVLDQAVVAKARQTWEQWHAAVGPPLGDLSWAYLTRATIAELESLSDPTRRETGLWEAVGYVERALVHYDGDSHRWGMLAKYLRVLQLRELALEAVERAHESPPYTYTVLTERLWLLAQRGSYDEAEAVAEDIIATYGHDPWVAGIRAWAALQQGTTTTLSISSSVRCRPPKTWPGTTT